MALIDCSECGHTVSDQANVCPSCGAPVDPPRPKATRTRRFFTFVVDIVGLNIFSYSFGILITFFLVVTENQKIGEALLQVPDILFGSVLFLFYYIPQEALWNRTLGKLVTGTRVETKDGNPVSLPGVLIRTVARFIPFEPFSLLFDSRPEGWHDSLADTQVVSLRETKEAVDEREEVKKQEAENEHSKDELAGAEEQGAESKQSINLASRISRFTVLILFTVAYVSFAAFYIGSLYLSASNEHFFFFVGNLIFPPAILIYALLYELHLYILLISGLVSMVIAYAITSIVEL